METLGMVNMHVRIKFEAKFSLKDANNFKNEIKMTLKFI